MTYEKALNIYVNGSSCTRPRRGGVGIRYVTIDAQGNEVVEDKEMPGHVGVADIEIKLLSCIQGLKGAFDHSAFGVVERIYVFTDSMYVTSNLVRAKFEWSKHKWLGRDGSPVEHADLWKELVRVLKKIPKRVDFKWVNDGAKDEHNKAVDTLAKRSAKGALGQPLKMTEVHKNKSPASSD